MDEAQGVQDWQQLPECAPGDILHYYVGSAVFPKGVQDARHKRNVRQDFQDFALEYEPRQCGVLLFRSCGVEALHFGRD